MKIDFYTRYKKAFNKYEGYLEKVLEPCTCGSESVECIMAMFGIRLACNECARSIRTRRDTERTSANIMVMDAVEQWNEEGGYVDRPTLRKLEPCRKCGSKQTTIERQTLFCGTVEGPDEVDEIALIAKCFTCGWRVHSRGDDIEEVSKALVREWNEEGNV